jgi:hypothetical protein
LYYVETLENDFRDIADTRPELFARHAAEAGQIDHIVSRSAGVAFRGACRQWQAQVAPRWSE